MFNLQWLRFCFFRKINALTSDAAIIFVSASIPCYAAALRIHISDCYGLGLLRGREAG